MTRSGPQKYPPASTARWYQDRYGGSAMESNVAVWHTTEGTSLPSYGGGASAPNLTALPDIPRRRLRWYQHFDFDTSSRALVNRAGGVETNTLNAVQIELVGTCDPAHRARWSGARAGRDYLYWPDAPDWALAELGEFVRWAHDEHRLKMRSSVDWTPYPESYGGGPYRLSGAQWRGYYGHLGHQHVPENDHGDPGNLDFTRVLEHARGTATNQEDDMPMSKGDAKTLWKTDGFIKSPKPGAENAYWQPASFLRDTNVRLREVQQRLAAQSAAITEMAKTMQALGQIVDPDGLVARIEAAIERVTVTLEVEE